jgi:hypothetical protein
MTTKNDDYLWDGSGTPDPDVERLEQLLGRLRSVPPVLPLPKPAPRRRLSAAIPFLAMAAVVILMVGLVWRTTRTSVPRTWEVTNLAGRPQIGAAALESTGRLAVGDTLTTDGSSRARLSVSAIGQVIVESDTRLRLVATGVGRHRLALDRGTLEAVISAPPGEFVVDTPSATATDLGCVYTLHVDDDGTGLLSVTVGWVAFELAGRESFVPAGASCRTGRLAGPGTPRFDDADHEFQMAVERFDFAGTETDRAAGLRSMLDRARPRDALTLWHLLPRVHESERADVFDALARRVPPPAGVSREKVLALDRATLDLWWDALHLGEAEFWRRWKRAIPIK